MDRAGIISIDRENIRRKKTFPFVMGDAKGCEITDVNGTKYLDFMAGLYGCVSIGWKQNKVLSDMKKQMSKFSFAPDRCPSEICSKLAQTLVEITPNNLSVCLRATSGSEAVDLAIKAARAASKKKGIIGMTGAYHGQTMGALSLGDKEKVKKVVKPMLAPIKRAQFPYCYRCKYAENCSNECLKNLEVIARKESCCSVILEPIQGVGAVMPTKEYLKEVKEICDKHSMYLIFDEVITGFGRTGSLFAFQHFGVEPDILVLGKGLSSGYAPIATTMVSKEISEKLGPSGNTTTFGWNPICAAAAFSNVNLILKNKLTEQTKSSGEYLSKLLDELMDIESVGEIRGTGLFWGIELVADKKTKKPAINLTEKVYNSCLENGLYLAIDGVNDNVLMITPPLIINKKQLNEGVSIIKKCLTNE